MAMADEERDDHRDDLSVRLEWPVDPLAATPDDTEDTDPLVRLEARLAALEDRASPDGDTMSREVAGAIDDVSARLDYVATELIEALRAMNDTMRELDESLRQSIDDTADAMRVLTDTLRQAVDENTAALEDRVTGLRTAMMAMLASRQAEEQRTQRRDRETMVAKIEEDMNAISRTLAEAIAASRTQSDVFADRVAAELQALRRRIAVKGRSSSIDDRVVDDIVSRVSDEIEIRMTAAIKPKSTSRKRS